MNEYVQCISVLKEMITRDRHLDDCLGSGNTPLAQQICYGVTRNWFYLEAVLDRLLKKPLPDKHLDLRLLLMAGIYSMDDLRRPAHASVNAAVESARLLNKDWAKGLINGVLRRYGRETDQIRKSTNRSEEAHYNHPGWLIDEIRSAVTRHEDVLAANQCQAPMTLRVNQRRCARDDYLRRLNDLEIAARPGQLSESAIILENAMHPGLLPGFDEGLLSVQDEGAQLAAGLLATEEGMNVLDACAAPGSKTCHLLEISDIELTAIDRDRKRTPRIEENLSRLGLNAEVVAEDLVSWREPGAYDRILLDAPCSATGIIRRHPDIKLLRCKSDIDKLCAIQRVLINKVFDLLVTGGELLYSTCSILPPENDEMITAILKSRSDIRVLPILQPDPYASIEKTEHGVQLLPTQDNHDGFYYARLKKVQS